MAKVFFTNKKPDRDLKKIEYVIQTPDFTEEVQKCKRFEPSYSKNITSSGHLRAILKEIQEKYNPYFSYWTAVPIGNYTGLQYRDDEELAKIVTKIVTNHSKETIYGYIRYKIINRPKDVRVIYMVLPEKDKNVEMIFRVEGIPEMNDENLYEELNFKTGHTIIGNTSLSTKRKERIYDDPSKTEEENREVRKKAKRKEEKERKKEEKEKTEKK